MLLSINIPIDRFLPQRPGCLFAAFTSTFMLVGLILLVVAGNQMLQEQKYQSGQCTITAKQLEHDISTTTSTNSNGSKTTTSTDVYAPYFEYTVHAANGRSYSANGYDGSNTYTSDRDGQQAIVDHYTIGQSYQCWYNPTNPAQAVLVRQPDWLLIILGGAFLLAGAFFTILVIIAFRDPSRQRERSGIILSSNEFSRYE